MDPGAGRRDGTLRRARRSSVGVAAKSRRGIGSAALAGAEPARLGCPSGRVKSDVEVRAAYARSEIPQRYTVTPHLVVEGVGAWPRMAREGQQCTHPIRRLG